MHEGRHVGRNKANKPTRNENRPPFLAPSAPSRRSTPASGALVRRSPAAGPRPLGPSSGAAAAPQFWSMIWKAVLLLLFVWLCCCLCFLLLLSPDAPTSNTNAQAHTHTAPPPPPPPHSTQKLTAATSTPSSARPPSRPRRAPPPAPARRRATCARRPTCEPRPPTAPPRRGRSR